MKKKWIWGAAVVLVLALSLGLYRFFTADDYRRVLPSRPLALAAVDWVRLSEENDMGMQDWKKLLPEGLEPGQTGIDWSKKMYAFVSSKEYVGLLAAVCDEADLRRLLDEAAKKGRCTPVEDYRGYSWTVWDGSWMVGFGDGALLMMGPGLKADMDALRYDMLACFRQKEAESGMSSPLFAELDRKDASFRGVSRVYSESEVHVVGVGIMPHKAAELVGSRHAHGQCLAAHGGVKFRVGRLHVRFQKEAADAEGEHAEQQPAKEGQLEDEEVPLLALHHLLAQFHSAGGGHIGVFGQQVGYQLIAILPVNARHNEQQEAQRDFQVGKQLHHDGVAVGAAEGADDGGDGRQGLAALHKIAAILRRLRHD